MRNLRSRRAVVHVLAVGLLIGCAGGGSTRGGAEGQPPMANPDAGGPSASSFFGGMLDSLLGGSD